MATKRRRSRRSVAAWSQRCSVMSQESEIIDLSQLDSAPSSQRGSPAVRRRRLRKGNEVAAKEVALRDISNDDNGGTQRKPASTHGKGRLGLARGGSRLDQYVESEAEVVGSDSGDEDDDEDDEEIEGLIDDSVLSEVSDGHRHRALLASMDSNSPGLGALRVGAHRLRRGGVLRAALRHAGAADDFEDAYERGDRAVSSQESAISGHTEDSRFIDTDDEEPGSGGDDDDDDAGPAASEWISRKQPRSWTVQQQQQQQQTRGGPSSSSSRQAVVIDLTIVERSGQPFQRPYVGSPSPRQKATAGDVVSERVRAAKAKIEANKRAALERRRAKEEDEAAAAATAEPPRADENRARLTEAQRARIEANKRAALEKKRRLAEQPVVVVIDDD